jgi:hypothetical protein
MGAYHPELRGSHTVFAEGPAAVSREENSALEYGVMQRDELELLLEQASVRAARDTAIHELQRRDAALNPFTRIELENKIADLQ